MNPLSIGTTIEASNALNSHKINHKISHIVNKFNNSLNSIQICKDASEWSWTGS